MQNLQFQKISWKQRAVSRQRKNAWTEKSEEWKKNREKQKAELSELSEKYEHLFEEKNFGFQRLMKAFPDMKSRENDKTLTEFKKHFRLDKPEQK